VANGDIVRTGVGMMASAVSDPNVIIPRNSGKFRIGLHAWMKNKSQGLAQTPLQVASPTPTTASQRQQAASYFGVNAPLPSVWNTDRSNPRARDKNPERFSLLKVQPAEAA